MAESRPSPGLLNYSGDLVIQSWVDLQVALKEEHFSRRSPGCFFSSSKMCEVRDGEVGAFRIEVVRTAQGGIDHGCPVMEEGSSG